MKFICVTDTRHWWQKFLKPALWEEVTASVKNTLLKAKVDKLSDKGSIEPGVLLYDMDVKIIEVDL